MSQPPDHHPRDPNYESADKEAAKGLAIFVPVMIWSSVVLVLGLLAAVLLVKIGAKKALAPPPQHSYIQSVANPGLPAAA